MISPETLRRYPYFAQVSDESLKAVAMIAEERRFKSGQRILEEREKAENLMILTAGSLETVYDLPSGKEVVVGALVPGDIFAISALLEPYEHTVTVRARSDGSMVAMQSAELRGLCEQDPALGYRLMHQVSRALRQRLNDARAELVGMS